MSHCKSHVVRAHTFEVDIIFLANRKTDYLSLKNEQEKKKARELAYFKHENSVPSPFFLPPPPERRGERGWTGRRKSERRRLQFRRISAENKHDNYTEFSNSKAHGQKDGQNTVRKHDTRNGDLAELRKEIAEKATAPHSSTLAWKLPWTEEPGRLQSMGSLRVRPNYMTSLSFFTFMHWRRKWQPTPVFLPGESQGRGSLVGCRLWGRTESDTTEVT